MQTSKIIARDIQVSAIWGGRFTNLNHDDSYIIVEPVGTKFEIREFSQDGRNLYPNNREVLSAEEIAARLSMWGWVI